jgi:hypothetical protein
MMIKINQQNLQNNFFRSHILMYQKVQKTLFSVTSPKFEILIKMRVKNQKSPFKHIRFGRTETPVKGLKQSTKRKETEYSL